MFFLRKTSTIHIELLFWNAPVKSSWTDLSSVWFAGATPVTIFFKHLFGKLVHISGESVHIFGELAHIFGKLVHIFARKQVSRTSKRVSKNLGPLWQPGVYNDTNICYTQQFAYGVASAFFFFSEIAQKKYVILSGKGAEILQKFCGNFAETCGNFSAMTPSRMTPWANCWYTNCHFWGHFWGILGETPKEPLSSHMSNIEFLRVRGVFSGSKCLGQDFSSDVNRRGPDMKFFRIFLMRPQDRRYLGGSASLFGITWKVSVAIFVVRASGQA